MPNECEFYFYDRDYCCSLLKQSNRKYVVDSDWVHRYCWGYNYNDCPYYRNKSDISSSSSGCYLTSACVYAKGLPDNCYELETLRKFRDNYMKSLPNGKTDIRHYYEIAPHIVHKINQQKDALTVWEKIYNELIIPCIKLIINTQYQEAYTKYKSFTLELESKYL